MTPEREKELRALCEAAIAIPMAPGYAASEDGRIFSFESNWRGYGTRELVQIHNSCGYPSVRLTIDGRRKHITVHRLIANVFLSSRPSPQHEIRHLDGCPDNRHWRNLAWGTRKENAQDRERHGRGKGPENGRKGASKLRGRRKTHCIYGHDKQNKINCPRCRRLQYEARRLAQ